MTRERAFVVSTSVPEGDQPKVFVFGRSADPWEMVAALATPTRAFASTFGHSLSADGAAFAIGDTFAERPEGRRGEVYLYGSSCTEDDSAVCLTGGRFRVEATWDTSDRQGAARAHRLTGDSASFTFFDDANVELVVKVLDACSVPGSDSFWVFAAGLTDLGIELRITDVTSGESRIYRSPRGTVFQPIRDTRAFPICAAR
jgi:hypothetical protein